MISQGKISEGNGRTQSLTTQSGLPESALVEAELLSRIAEAAAGEEDLRSILVTALQQLKRILAFTGGSIALVEGEELVLCAAVGPFAAEAMGQRMVRGKGRLWQVIETGRPFFCSDLQAEGVDSVTPLRSYLAVPLLSRRETFGILEIDSTEPNAFNPTDTVLLQRVATLLSSPIELARLRAIETQAHREAKNAQETLLDQARRYHFLANAMPQMVWTARPDGGMDYFNRKWHDYTGLTFEQSREEGWQKALHPDDLAECREHWTASIETGQEFEIEYRFRNMSDGAYRWHLGRALPLRNGRGEIVQWVGTCTDIDDQKRTEAALREAERFARAALDGLAAHIAVLDGEGKILAVNRAWRDFAQSNGAPADLMAEGANYLRICDQAEGPCSGEAPVVAGGIRAVIRGERERFVLEYPCHSPTEERWFNLRVTKFPDAGQAQAIISHEDISSRRLAEDSLRRRALDLARAKRELERANQELDQFAYITSHDLKAPLRGIANLSQWIEEDLGTQVTEETRRQLELMRGRVHRMEAMIEGILQYSRIGRVEIKPERVDVGALLNEIIDLLAPPKHVQITLGSPMPLLVTEKLRLQQVFMNLISNAIKHNTRPDAKVLLTAKQNEASIEFTVADNGPGIARMYHEKVFVIFQTLEARDKTENTGIGLSLVKKIVEAEGGTISLVSEEGQGATFRFTWPYRGEEAE